MTTIPTTILHRSSIVKVGIVICIEMNLIKIGCRIFLGKTFLKTSILYEKTHESATTRKGEREKTRRIGERRTLKNGE